MDTRVVAAIVYGSTRNDYWRCRCKSVDLSSIGQHLISSILFRMDCIDSLPFMVFMAIFRREIQIWLVFIMAWNSNWFCSRSNYFFQFIYRNVDFIYTWATAFRRKISLALYG